MDHFRCKKCGGGIANFTVMKYFRDGSKEIGPFHEHCFAEGKKRYMEKKLQPPKRPYRRGPIDYTRDYSLTRPKY